MRSKANDVTAGNKKIRIELIREAPVDYKKLDGSAYFLETAAIKNIIKERATVKWDAEIARPI